MRFKPYIISRFIKPFYYEEANSFLSFFLSFFLLINVTSSQSCENACIPLISNQNLQLTEISNDQIFLVDAFNQGYVDPWVGTINSAHLAFDDGNDPCQKGYYNYDASNLPFNCLYSKWIPSLNIQRGYLEEVAQEVNFFANDFYTYCVNIDVRSLSCEPQAGDGRLIVRTGDGQSISNFYYESLPLALPGANTAEVIEDIVVPAQGAVSISTIFTPNIDNTYLRIANAVETPGISYMTIDHAKVTCETSSISDIIVTQVGQTVSFEAINDSPFPYTDYGWAFGDGTTGGTPNPSHTYDEPGEYEVCLNIFDENKCCGTFCKDIIVSPPSTSCPMDDETIFIDADVTSSFSDLVALGMYQSGGTLVGKDIVVKGAFVMDEKFTFNNCNFNFEPGAELIIEAPGLVLMIESNFQGCNQMWKGITVSGQDQGNLFWMTGGSINDAYAGIEIMDQANMFVYGVDFNNNYMGVYSAPSSSLKAYKGFPIMACKFTSNGGMLQEYNGQPGWETITFAGANINDLDHFSMIGINDFVTGQLKRNRFDGIMNGILYKNVNMIIHKNLFKNIQINENNFGVKGEECGVSSIINNIFLNTNQPVHIINSLNALISINKNRVIEDNSAVVSGGIKIYVNGVNSSDIEIEDNELFSEIKGGAAITVSNCSSLTDISISNNVLDNSLQPFMIILSNVHKEQGAEGVISNNRVNPNSNFDNIHTGIKLISSHNFVVSDNIMKSHKEANTPFNFTNSSRCLIEGNDATLHPSSVNKSNYYVNISPGNIYCCNSANNGEKGFYFSGQNGETELRSSQFYNTRYGLDLYNAEIGDQNLYGNYWENQNSNTKARFSATLGSSISYLNSFVYVNPNQTGTRPIVVQPNDWFDNQFGQAQLCAENNADITCGSTNWDGFNFISPIPNGDPCELFKNELIDLVGQNVYWHFQNQNDWVFYTYVFDNYKDIPLEYWTDCFPIPDKNVNVKTIAEYYHTDKSYKEAYKLTSAETYQVKQNQTTIVNNLSALNGLYQNIETNQDYEVNKVAILNLQSQINTSSNIIHTINNTVKKRGERNLQYLRNIITDLPSDFYFLDELKYVWKRKIQVDLLGIESISSNQWNKIERISNQCDLEYGSAVFEAQSLMSLIGVTEFDSEASCESIKPRNSDDNEKLINVFPNPSNGVFTIEMSNNKPMLSVANVYDVNGTLIVNSRRLVSNESNFTIDISNKLSGVYYLEVNLANGSKFTKKLVLIK